MNPILIGPAVTIIVAIFAGLMAILQSLILFILREQSRRIARLEDRAMNGTEAAPRTPFYQRRRVHGD